MRTSIAGLGLSLFLVLSMTPRSVSAQPTPTVDTIKDQWVSIEEEPYPLTPIEKNIVYPFKTQQGVSVKITFSFLVGADGCVERAEALTPADTNLIALACPALLRTHFSPAKQHSVPVKVWVTRQVDVLRKVD